MAFGHNGVFGGRGGRGGRGRGGRGANPFRNHAAEEESDPSSPAHEPSPEDISYLRDMGYTEFVSRRALQTTGSTERAIDFILRNPDRFTEEEKAHNEQQEQEAQRKAEAGEQPEAPKEEEMKDDGNLFFHVTEEECLEFFNKNLNNISIIEIIEYYSHVQEIFKHAGKEVKSKILTQLTEGFTSHINNVKTHLSTEEEKETNEDFTKLVQFSEVLTRIFKQRESLLHNFEFIEKSISMVTDILETNLYFKKRIMSEKEWHLQTLQFEAKTQITADEQSLKLHAYLKDFLKLMIDSLGYIKLAKQFDGQQAQEFNQLNDADLSVAEAENIKRKKDPKKFARTIQREFGIGEESKEEAEEHISKWGSISNESLVKLLLSFYRALKTNFKKIFDQPALSQLFILTLEVLKISPENRKLFIEEKGLQSILAITSRYLEKPQFTQILAIVNLLAKQEELDRKKFESIIK